MEHDLEKYIFISFVYFALVFNRLLGLFHWFTMAFFQFSGCCPKRIQRLAVQLGPCAIGSTEHEAPLGTAPLAVVHLSFGWAFHGRVPYN